MAFAVAWARSWCTHEQCSRMLAISTRYGFRPADCAALRKVFRCMWGEQEATTTPSSVSEAIFSRTIACPGIGAHVLVVQRTAHAGKLGDLFRNFVHVYRARDVLAAPAGEDTNPGHCLSFRNEMPVNAQLLG